MRYPNIDFLQYKEAQLCVIHKKDSRTTHFTVEPRGLPRLTEIITTCATTWAILFGHVTHSTLEGVNNHGINSYRSWENTRKS